MILGIVPVAAISANPKIFLYFLQKLTHAVCISTFKSRDAFQNVHSDVHHWTDRTFNTLRVDNETWFQIPRLALQVWVRLVAFHKKFVGGFYKRIGDKILVLLFVKFPFLR